MDFVHGSVQHINHDLLQLSSQLLPREWRLHPRIIYFHDAKDKDRKQLVLYNQLIKNNNPADFAQAEVDDLKRGDTISDGLRSLKQSGSILLLSGLAEKDLESRGSSPDHVILLFLKNRTLYIYDPDWEASPPGNQTRIGDLQGQIRAVQVFKATKGKFVVESIRTGGGGNLSGIDCLPMCMELLWKMIAGDTEALDLKWAVETINK